MHYIFIAEFCQLILRGGWNVVPDVGPLGPAGCDPQTGGELCKGVSMSPLTYNALYIIVVLTVDESGGASVSAGVRGLISLFAARPFRLEGGPLQDGSLALWARGPDGELAMSATVEFHRRFRDASSWRFIHR